MFFKLLRMTMTIHETDESKWLGQLKKKFDAEPEHYTPDEEELRFLKERDKLEQETEWSFELYLENYDKLKEYGLDEKLMIQLEWFIIFYLENRKDEFLGSAFYQMFKNHEVVRRAEMEYERRINL